MSIDIKDENSSEVDRRQIRNEYFSIIQELLKDIEPAPDIPTPKLDFERQSTNPQDTTMEIKAKFDFDIPEPVLKFLKDHYTRTSAILGLDLIPDNYILIVEKLKGTRDGEHEQSFGTLKKGKIKIDSQAFEKACKVFVDNSELGNDWQTLHLSDEISFLNQIYAIETIAHEQYHRRQATFFKTFFNARVIHYVNAEEDSEKYMNQIMEVGARAFAISYIDLLKGELDENDNSNWAKSLRAYQSSFDYDKQKITFLKEKDELYSKKFGDLYSLLIKKPQF